MTGSVDSVFALSVGNESNYMVDLFFGRGREKG